MDTCPEHIDPKLWKSSCLLRIEVRNRERLTKELETIEDTVKDENEERQVRFDEEGTQFVPLVFAKEPGDRGYEEKSLLKSLELSISDKISSWEKGNA